MLDIDLLVAELRRYGHSVVHVIKVPENAGDYEFEMDGKLLSLDEVRLVLEQDQTRA